MKVSGVCPTCHRPVASKAKGVCLYCGNAITPVDTGQIAAPGSGTPLPTEQIPPAAAPPPVPRPTKSVPNLYADRAAKMQAEGINPVAEFLKTGLGKFLIWISCIGLGIGGLVYLIESQRPKNVDLSIPAPPRSTPAPMSSSITALVPPGEAPKRPEFGTEAEAISFLADQILASIPEGASFPDALPPFVAHPAAGSDVARAAGFFLPKQIEYRRTLSQDFKYEGFELVGTTQNQMVARASRSRQR